MLPPRVDAGLEAVQGDGVADGSREYDSTRGGGRSTGRCPYVLHRTRLREVNEDFEVKGIESLDL